jgi:uncharacterized phiE125 gp8 family phage protein
MTLQPLRLEVSALDASPFPLDIALVKQHCAIDGDDFDGLIDVYMKAAILWAEGAMHRTVYARDHSWVLRDFPRDGCQDIWLPRGKTQSVESIVYYQGGSAHTLTGPSSTPAGSGYQEDLGGDHGGVIMPVAGGSWPSVDLDVPRPVAINFTAGYLTEEVPDDILHALLFSVSDAFDMRGSADITSGGRNFETREALISGYRMVRFY